MRHRHTAIGASLLVLAAAGVAACGDDEEPADTGTGPAETAAAPGGPAVETVDVSETEYELDPADPELEKSGLVRFNVSNDGSVDHSLEIEAPLGESETDTLAPGESATLEVDLPPGEHTWYCPIGNHRELGMEGTVTVAGDSEGGGGSDEPDAGSGADEPDGGGGGGGGY